MFTLLEKINSKPQPFEYYTAKELWTDEYTAKKMFTYHMDGTVDISSRRFSFINNSVEWITSHFNITNTARIADFGCGPGLYTTRLAKKGATVTGIDFSRNSLEYAQQQAEVHSLDVTYVHKNYLDYETTDTFDLIIMIMCDFCAISPEQRKRLLEKFYRFLGPGGHVILDVYSLHAFKRKEECAFYAKNLLDGFWTDQDYYGFMNSFTYKKEKVSLDKYTIITKTDIREIYNWLQYFTRETLAREFEAAGFSIEDYYADVAGTPFSQDGDEFALVAVKK